MKKLFSIVTFLAVAFSAQSQTPAFKRTGTNLPFVTTISNNQVFLIDRGGGLAPANIRYDALQTNFLTGSLGFSTNVPARGQGWGGYPVPSLGVDSWNTFSSVLNLSPWKTNFQEWATNTIVMLQTNLAYLGYDQLWVTDGWQAAARVSNDLTWDSTLLPIGVPALCDFAHERGIKVMLYTAVANLSCSGLPGSYITNAYRDVQKMMSWGADGTMFDLCDAGLYNTATFREYQSAYVRTINQAIADYHDKVASTGGVVRAFYIQMTPGNANTDPDKFATELLYGVNAVNQNYGIPYSADGWSVIQGGRRIARTYRDKVGPGHFMWTHSLYENAANFDRPAVTNLMNVSAMTLQPLRMGLGNMAIPNYTPSGQPFYNTVTNGIWRCRELLDIWRDKSCIAASITYSNQECEVWSRPLSKPENFAVLVANYGVNVNNSMRVNVNDFGGYSNNNYTARNPWTGAEFNFQNQFGLSIAASNTAIYQVFPQRSVSRTNAVDLDALTVSGVNAGGYSMVVTQGWSTSRTILSLGGAVTEWNFAGQSGVTGIRGTSGIYFMGPNRSDGYSGNFGQFFSTGGFATWKGFPSGTDANDPGAGGVRANHFVAQNIITNGAAVWHVTNNVPSFAYPNGSIAVNTAGGSGSTFYVRESGSWISK